MPYNVEPTEIFIVQVFGSPIADNGLLNSVMDNDGNTVCWTDEHLAQRWIHNNLPGRNFIVVRKNLNEWRFELELLKRDHSLEVGVRIVDTVEF